ncbi:esterase family protein [Nocardia sp. CDC159]|uniref:Esterase family protein n=1 Tax=Nocardia pulmonis TaxID=2951408 RepID=A0A9X2IXN4_9NOCA|nr:MULTISPECIES: alpha/beta hydrolase family protein [Nocardia]MCM6776212.1 esterase family protein [Nocardia pulmonis]MCM6788462.1 esterase family protein [Nocardia sp. CDC159]
MGASHATADPTEQLEWMTSIASEDGSKIAGVEQIDDRNIRLQIYSAAMDKTFPVEIQRPADTSAPRPSLYLLSGLDAGESLASWQAQTDVRPFLSDKNVNLIMPIGGKASYYTDWVNDDPVLGRNKWRTYLTEELPPLLNAALGTNEVNAIAGISTSGTSVLALPIAKPGLYKAAASYSGCAQTSDPTGAYFVKTAVGMGGGNPYNMWGPMGSPEWAANDPYLHAEGLRGLELYFSSGNGRPGEYDTLDGRKSQLDGVKTQIDGKGDQLGVFGLLNQLTIGGTIESATNYCTHNMQKKLEELGIPATFHYTSGTHSWGYWEDEFKASWPVIARGIGLSEE